MNESETLGTANKTIEISRKNADAYEDHSVNAELKSLDPRNFIEIGLKLTPEEKISIIRRGPFQPEKHELMEKNYPQEHGHRFNTNQYYRVLHSGERIKRDWLSFSVSNSRMYCLYCMFFGKNKQRSWTVDGFHAWQRLQDIS
ncbi:zinc finger MYM-type protein 5-like [Myzus persicae]|uniref:zinc finger MYM-type protein 5-like n=1 Tax=Myzus persicae TaxID=13164 RepID=UPI000B934AF1|nr:zinc finger MYM-type protein 5-like [Myzus persicae]